jgi:hypothetical protein
MATVLSLRTVIFPGATDWQGAGGLLLAPLPAYALAGLFNFRTRRPFSSGAFALLLLFVAVALGLAALRPNPQLPDLRPALDLSVLPASALITLALWMMTALAALLATRLGLTGTLIACGGLFMAGLITDYLLGGISQTNLFFSMLYAVLPNWQNFWLVDALNRDGIPWDYVAQSAVYAGFYVTAALCAGILIFERAEVR